MKENETNGLLRPTPITNELEVLEYASHISPEIAVNELLEGNYVLIIDFYGSGLAILEALRKRVIIPQKAETFKELRQARNRYRELSHHLLLEVSNNSLVVRKAPSIGWLKELYTDITDFFLPFPEIQGLNSAWQWYEKGIFIPGLRYKLRPYYGTYFPTRFEHLELFESYLKQKKEATKRAVDVGIGSGVLSFFMQKHGIQNITGCDTNPNALIGLDKLQKTFPAAPQIELIESDLFTSLTGEFDLIVFNPPWIPMKGVKTGIDAAMYYTADLFESFFKGAAAHLSPNGELVLIFSNLAGLMDPEFIHPIASEIKNNNRFQLQVKNTLKAKPESAKTQRDSKWRKDEFVELWVLKHK